MALDFSTLIPVGGAVDPLNLAAACQRLSDLAAASGDAVPAVPSNATCSIFAGDADATMLVSITGTTGITSFGVHEAGERRLVRFASAGCTVTHSAGLSCPGGANFTSEAGTLALVVGDGTDTAVWQVWHPSVLGGATLALPPGFIFGLTLSNNVTDATNDIDIAVGRCRDDADTVNHIHAIVLTKRLDAVWGEGTNAGMLDTGTKANSTTYHLFSIGNGVATDYVVSASLSSPNMPTGAGGLYTTKRRLGSIITDGSGVIRAFVQAGDEFLLVTPVLDVNVSTLGTSRSLYALTVPAGLSVEAMIRAYNLSGAANVWIGPASEADQAPSDSASPLFTLAGTDWNSALRIRTNTSRQIAARSNAGSTSWRAATLGWTDRRGRDA